MEHQLKLHSESLQSRIDELEKENAESGKNKPTSEVNLQSDLILENFKC